MSLTSSFDMNNSDGKKYNFFYDLMKMITSNRVSELLKMQLESRSRNVHTHRTLVGSFQHTLWPRKIASEAALLVSRAFALVFTWFKVAIAQSLCLSSGALQHTVHTSTIVAKIVSFIFFELQYFGPESRSNKNSNTNPVSKLQTADREQNAD